MSTQRQKKRNAQYRKKHHGQKAREDGGKRGVVAKPSGEPVEDRGRPHAPGSVQEQPPPLPEAASGEGSDYKDKQYSKRKVVSNWDRYSEDSALDGESGGGGDPESERELERRLVQLLHLPTATPEAIGSLPGGQESFPPLPPFLSLDCDALASSLASLPLHQRLDLSLEILSMAEDSGTSPTPEQRASHDTASLTSRGGQTFAPEQFAFHFPSPDAFAHVAKELPQRSLTSTEHSADGSVGGSSSPPLNSSPKPHPPPAPAPVKAFEVPVASQSANELDDILDELLA